MKKLMIAAAIVCAAVMGQAAQYTWKTATSGGKVYEPGSTENKYTGEAYIFADAGETTQAKIFAALCAPEADISKLGSLDKSDVSSGAIASKSAAPFDYNGDITAFFVIVDGDNFYIAPTAEAKDPGQGSAAITFKATATSQAAAKMASDGYKGAGWYTVPEPTSGLLLLLGVAGLALKRRRA